MSTWTAPLGLAFIVIGLAAMFLAMHLWGYPFDKATRTSAAPRWATLLHRVLGVVFTLIYIVMMWHMVPRLWEYQVEFPARTVAHILLGFTIGFLLLLKIAIIRFFRHFEEWMPYLGTGIMLCSVLMIGLSLPVFFHEAQLAAAAPGGSATSPESLARLRTRLPDAGFPDGVDVAALATPASLARGRDALLGKCIKCHDLKTVLARPRSPQGWWQVVERMADKPALFAPLTDDELYTSTAYLIAISPDLQRSAKQRRQAELAREIGEQATDPTSPDAAPGPDAAPAPGPDTVPTPGPDASPAPVGEPVPPTANADAERAKAEATFARVCGDCHDLADVDADPPRSRKEAQALVRRMVRENEAEFTAEEVRLAVDHMVRRYVDGRK